MTWFHGPDVFSCNTSNCDGAVGLFSFSGGYLAFDTRGLDDQTKAPEVVPMVSRDGLSWRSGPAILDLGDLGKAVVQVGEGPGGLIAVVRSGVLGLCGTYPIWIEGLLTSSDGLTWAPVNLARAFGGAAVYDVSAGPSGYVADGVATDGVTTEVWTSPDAKSWKSTILPGQVMGAAEADNAVSFEGGFELAAEDFGGCGSFPLRTNSLWWSQDGSAWVKSDFGGASPSLAVSAAIYHPMPGRLLAICRTSADGGKTIANAYWTTSEGQLWSAVAGPRLTGDASNVFSYGGRALIVSWSYATYDSTPVPAPTIVSVNPDGTLTTLAQKGTSPKILPTKDSWISVPNVALGPSGLAVTDGKTIWYGVPSS